MAEDKNIVRIKLYCALHGNNALSMHDDATIDANCIKCRAKNEGICNIRYNGNNRQILYDEKTGKILTMSEGGYLEKEWLDGGYRKFKINGKIYSFSKVGICWFCFGFLRNE